MRRVDPQVILKAFLPLFFREWKIGYARDFDTDRLAVSSIEEILLPEA